MYNFNLKLIESPVTWQRYKDESLKDGFKLINEPESFPCLVYSRITDGPDKPTLVYNIFTYVGDAKRLLECYEEDN